ncbi:MAG: NTP transferase domain-containing protein, partial [Microvirga sp.]
MRLGTDDVGEDEAALRLAERIAGPHARVDRPFTGRANLFAEKAGVLVVDRSAIDGINAIDEAITVATLAAHKAVVAGEMIGTVKIIPYAVPDAILKRALAVLDGAVRVAPYVRRRIAVASTVLPGLKPSVIKKTLDVLGERIAPAEAAVVQEVSVPHDSGRLAEELRRLASSEAELVIVFGASAIADRRDVIPAALEAAGGKVEHFGMPVDPGNLLLLARRGDMPVLGLPGCARSPKLNGFDWVLQRIAAGVPVTRRDIMMMGAGGLLTEIPTRPLPRASATETEPVMLRAPRIAALILAAGQSRRMGALNKMIAEVDGKPMVAHALAAVTASQAGPIVVVTGHEPDAVRAALAGHEIRFVHNPHYADGLSTSLRAGLAALPTDIDGVLVCLGDMPRVGPETLNRLIAAYNPVEGRAICVPTVDGKRGNPVLWDKRFFAEMQDLAGDVGARHLIGAHA